MIMESWNGNRDAPLIELDDFQQAGAAAKAHRSQSAVRGVLLGGVAPSTLFHRYDDDESAMLVSPPRTRTRTSRTRTASAP